MKIKTELLIATELSDKKTILRLIKSSKLTLAELIYVAKFSAGRFAEIFEATVRAFDFTKMNLDELLKTFSVVSGDSGMAESAAKGFDWIGTVQSNSDQICAKLIRAARHNESGMLMIDKMIDGKLISPMLVTKMLVEESKNRTELRAHASAVIATIAKFGMAECKGDLLKLVAKIKGSEYMGQCKATSAIMTHFNLTWKETATLLKDCHWRDRRLLDLASAKFIGLSPEQLAKAVSLSWGVALDIIQIPKNMALLRFVRECKRLMKNDQNLMHEVRRKLVPA